MRKTLTMRLANLYENLSQGLPSERLRDFTLNNITSTVTDFDITNNQPFVFASNSRPDVYPFSQAEYRFTFEPDGNIQVRSLATGFNGVNQVTNTSGGSWASSAPGTPGNYSIEITSVQAFAGLNYTTPVSYTPYFTGSVQTPLALSSDRVFDFALVVENAPGDSIRFNVTFELVDNLGLITQRSIELTLTAEMADLSPGGGF